MCLLRKSGKEYFRRVTDSILNWEKSRSWNASGLCNVFTKNSSATGGNACPTVRAGNFILEIKKLLNPTEILEEEKEVEQVEKVERFSILNNNENKNLLNQIETLDLDFNKLNVLEDTNEYSSELNDISQLILDSKKSLQDKYEIFDIPTAEEYIAPSEIKPKEEEKVENKKIISGDLNSVINSLKDIEKEIKEAGFSIETEDYDFEDLYQIIIKIEK